MKLMIAGGLGYIGSAVCELYREATQHEIIVMDKRFIPERVAALPPHMKYVQADMRDTETMKVLLEGVDTLFLLAAEVEAEKSANKERAVWEHNFEAPCALIEACPPATRILFPSTGNVFGGVQEGEKFMDLTEEDKPHPKYPYAETKVAMEQFLHKSGRNYVILRFGTNHGFAPGIRFNLVTNNFVRKSLLGEDLTVHGNGANYRPTVCVNDCARALDFLANHEKATGEIYHVVRHSYQIRELAANVVTTIGHGSKVEYIAKEVPFSAYALNSDKIQKLGFEFAWDLESSVMDMKGRFRQMVAPTKVSSA